MGRPVAPLAGGPRARLRLAALEVFPQRRLQPLCLTGFMSLDHTGKLEQDGPKTKPAAPASIDGGKEPTIGTRRLVVQVAMLP